MTSAARGARPMILSIEGVGGEARGETPSAAASTVRGRARAPTPSGGGRGRWPARGARFRPLPEQRHHGRQRGADRPRPGREAGRRPPPGAQPRGGGRGGGVPGPGAVGAGPVQGPHQRHSREAQRVGGKMRVSPWPVTRAGAAGVLRALGANALGRRFHSEARWRHAPPPVKPSWAVFLAAGRPLSATLRPHFRYKMWCCWDVH